MQAAYKASRKVRRSHSTMGDPTPFKKESNTRIVSRLSFQKSIGPRQKSCVLRLPSSPPHSGTADKPITWAGLWLEAGEHHLQYDKRGHKRGASSRVWVAGGKRRRVIMPGFSLASWEPWRVCDNRVEWSSCATEITARGASSGWCVGCTNKISWSCWEVCFISRLELIGWCVDCFLSFLT